VTAQRLDDNLVRVSVLADGDDGAIDPGAAVVQWTWPADGRVFQVYLNGELSAWTSDPAQRELIAGTDASDLLAVAVMAVDLAQVETSFADRLTPQQRGRRVLLRWPRTNDAPLGATVNLFTDGGSGTIDFDTALNREPIDWFEGTAGKWGFALGGFGGDDFGHGGSRAVGLGPGGFGLGEFGFDAAMAAWLSDALGPGTHTFAAVAADALGNVAPGAPPQTAVTLSEPPGRIGGLEVEGVGTDAVGLTWQTTSN